MKRNDLWSANLTLQSLYRGSNVCVKINGAYTDWFDIRRGVGQECVACLFNLLMDSCLYDLKEYECRLKMDELSVECLLYADDRKSLLCRRAGCRRCHIGEWCGLKEDVVTRVEKDLLRWFGHLERMNESSLIKRTYGENVRGRKLHRVRPDGTCECRRRVTCAMDDAWRKSSRHRMSQETVTGRFPSLPGRRRLAAAGWSKGA
ncbi:hypothetical protein EVAR_59372_1 [Eumeta japonica]|uniref:Reverse transcriptase domain-containing protein n=1 Tax=Eumeta variegata TaxID=151549 RepID=A0A4C1ZWB4_EUMVA|nr:hypothetical protein EVAR_59372_1 [Eumeta japonica]